MKSFTKWTTALRATGTRLCAILCVLAASGASSPTYAQDTDAIGAVLSAPPSASDTAPEKQRTFSPKAISDLLKLDDGSSQAAAVPRSLDVPISMPRNAPDPLFAPASALLTPDAINVTRFARVNEASRVIDPVVLKAEILLDRNHAPPGVIDGRFGSNFVKAISTFETVRGLPVDGKLTRRVWDELGGDTAAPVLGTYTITPQDIIGPFYPDLSPDYAEQAKMPDLGYRSPEEMFGERFHMDRKFLKALNPGVDMSVAGTMLVVAEVAALPIASTIARIDVDKGKGQVQAYDAGDNLIVAYPATIGSEELPSPSGSYFVRGIAPHPTYTYNPKLNFQQGSNTQKLILPPGPNNPVGAAFIALSKPTYGIHGTPDPSKIDKTRSHGCVRLTNWNAVELAGLVKVGVPVNFIDKPGTEPAPSPEPDIASILGPDFRPR